MALSVRTDDNWPGGGFALLSGEGLDGVTSVTIENCLSKQLLNAQGQWGKFPHAFPVAPTPSGSLLMGPDIVDHVPTELFILLRDQTGAELGKIFWADVMPSRNPGSATLSEVLAVHRGRAVVADAVPKPPPAVEPVPVVIASPPPPPAPPPPVVDKDPIEPPPPVPPPSPPLAASTDAIEPPPVPPPVPLPPPPVVDNATAEPPPPVPPPRPIPDGGTILPPVAAASVLPLWLRISLTVVFCSTLLLVTSIVLGVV